MNEDEMKERSDICLLAGATGHYSASSRNEICILFEWTVVIESGQCTARSSLEMEYVI